MGTGNFLSVQLKHCLDTNLIIRPFFYLLILKSLLGICSDLKLDHDKFESYPWNSFQLSGEIGTSWKQKMQQMRRNCWGWYKNEFGQNNKMKKATLHQLEILWHLYRAYLNPKPHAEIILGREAWLCHFAHECVHWPDITHCYWCQSLFIFGTPFLDLISNRQRSLSMECVLCDLS